MKTALLLLIILFPISIWGQTYCFPTNNSHWGVNFEANNSAQFQETVIGEDSIANGHTYKKLLNKDNATNKYTTAGLIRNGEDKKVYAQIISKTCHGDLSDSAEYLLYDFSLNIGDYFDAHMFTVQKTFRFKVAKKDSIDLNTKKHLRLQLTPFDTVGSDTNQYWGNKMDNSFYWIEGVGSSFGPLYNNMPLYSSIEDSSYIVCFQTNDTLEIGDDLCSFLLPTNSIQSNEANIYPNPTNNIINISLENNHIPCSIEIYNLQGVLKYIYQATTLQTQISNSELENGINIIKIVDSKSNYIGIKRVICIK
ncbi:MAG: T9SS type A sorting domain-containing protein [Bacteroidota bacterium]